MNQSGSSARKPVVRAAALVGSALALAAQALVPQGVHAQAFPSKPVTVISAVPTGGGGDTAARVIAAKMSTVLGKPVVVDTRGAGGASMAAVASVADRKSTRLNSSH